MQTLPDLYLELYLSSPRFQPAAMGRDYNLTAIKELFESLDFIGIGNRPALTVDFPVQHLENGTYQFELELATFGVNLTELQVEQVCCYF